MLRIFLFYKPNDIIERINNQFINIFCANNQNPDYLF